MNTLSDLYYTDARRDAFIDACEEWLDQLQKRQHRTAQRARQLLAAVDARLTTPTHRA